MLITHTHLSMKNQGDEQIRINYLQHDPISIVVKLFPEYSFFYSRFAFVTTLTVQQDSKMENHFQENFSKKSTIRSLSFKEMLRHISRKFRAGSHGWYSVRFIILFLHSISAFQA